MGKAGDHAPIFQTILSCAQLRDRARVMSKLGRTSSVCWPSSRRRDAAPSTRRVGELERDAEHLQRADGRVLDRLDHVARERVRVVERGGDRIDLAARHAGCS